MALCVLLIPGAGDGVMWTWIHQAQGRISFHDRYGGFTETAKELHFKLNGVRRLVCVGAALNCLASWSAYLNLVCQYMPLFLVT